MMEEMEIEPLITFLGFLFYLLTTDYTHANTKNEAWSTKKAHLRCVLRLQIKNNHYSNQHRSFTADGFDIQGLTWALLHLCVHFMLQRLRQTDYAPSITWQ